jgi:hypothetical protein
MQMAAGVFALELFRLPELSRLAAAQGVVFLLIRLVIVGSIGKLGRWRACVW